MPVTEINIPINQPVEEVFEYAVDVDRLKEWNVVIQDSWMTSGAQTEVGSTYIVKAKIMGQVMEIPSEILAYEHNRLFTYRAGGSMPYASTKFFEETEYGVRITERLEMEREGRLSRLLSPIMLRISKRSHQKNLELLKEKLEGSEVAIAT